MVSFTVSSHIAAPPEDVFARATDFAGAPAFIRGIVKMEVLTPGAVGVGTRVRETRIMFKREATEEMEVTSFEPPRTYALGCDNHGCRYRTTFTFAPQHGGTDVELRFEARPLTWTAKVMGLVMRPLAKLVCKQTAADLEDLKTAVEADRGGGSSRP